MASNCTRMIEVNQLVFADNVRTPECMAIPGIVESFKRHGYKPNHPLVVSEKAGDSPTYLVLNGNRRGTGLVWLRENDRETFQRTVPSGKVPAIVHKGLTREEEVELRIDHSSDEDRVPLDEWSIFLAISQLVKAGIDTQERIAVKLGLFKTRPGKQKGQPRREYVQVRVNLARLPAFVQDEFRKLTLDKDSTPVRYSHIARLYKAYNEEYVDHPEGDGLEFGKVWQEVTTPSTVDDTDSLEGSAREPRELTPAEAVKRSQSASSKGLKQTLLVVTRQSNADLSEIDAAIVAGETALLILDDIRLHLGESDYGNLVAASTKQGDDRRAAEKELKEYNEKVDQEGVFHAEEEAKQPVA